ncbi:MAG: transporter [Pelagibacteraceae bacterium TMED287]|nr:MAG: transporter [Pelagibacteraceae bacterium TMED287]|tara:strand:- start:150 stop:1049 length:900 start_codon:yes stop_codon:yes gene_type:complete
MEIYLKLLDVLFPVFFIIGVGYYLGIKDPKFDTKFITNFAGNIGTPAMIFYTITTTGVTLSVFIEYFIYALIVIGGFSIVGLAFLFFLKKDVISELPPLILPNTGNMGVPICLFAYGTAGLGVASAIASVIILLHFTVGVLLAKKSFSLQILIKNVPIYGLIIAVIFLYFEWEVPGFIENTTFLLTYTTIFLVLMSLGIALSRFKVVSWTHASILGGVRVIVGPIIGFSLIKYLDLDGFPAGVLLIQSSMPSAVLTYLVGSMYSKKRVVDSVASVIVTSTLMSLITIPIVVYYSLKFFQ